jgi:hypothetical protein
MSRPHFITEDNKDNIDRFAQNPGRGKNLSLYQKFQTICMTDPAYSVGTGALSLGVKRPGC